MTTGRINQVTDNSRNAGTPTQTFHQHQRLLFRQTTGPPHENRFPEKPVSCRNTYDSLQPTGQRISLNFHTTVPKALESGRSYGRGHLPGGARSPLASRPKLEYGWEQLPSNTEASVRRANHSPHTQQNQPLPLIRIKCTPTCRSEVKEDPLWEETDRANPSQKAVSVTTSLAN